MRKTSGASTGVTCRPPGLGRGGFDVHPGHHAIKNETGRDNPFPSTLILAEGKPTAIVGGIETAFKAGAAIFVPQGVSDEFINNTDKPEFGFFFLFEEGT